MGLYTRLIGSEDPKINAHAWPKAYADAVIPGTDIDFLTLATHWSLSDKNQVIASVFTGTDKLGMSVSHTWLDTDVVFFVTTGTIPAGLSLTTPYYVINSNPTEGSIKVSLTSGGVAVDITSVGSGTHTLYRIDDDVGHYSDQRKGITGNSTRDKRLAQIVWDEKAEGTVEQAEEGIAYTAVANLKTRLEDWATYISE